MTTIDPISGLPSTSSTTPTGTSGALGKDDFLKLLVGQLQHQDPMDPSGSQDFIGQMAQFSTLEQISNVALAATQMLQATHVQQSVGLIGRTVTWTAEDGTSSEGVVDQVSLAAGNPTLTISGTTGIDPAAVTEVK